MVVVVEAGVWVVEDVVEGLLVVAAAVGSGKYSVVSGVGGGVPLVPPST